MMSRSCLNISDHQKITVPIKGLFWQHSHEHILGQIDGPHLIWRGNAYKETVHTKLLLILQTFSAKSVLKILLRLSIGYILNACWSSGVETAGSIWVRSLVFSGRSYKIVYFKHLSKGWWPLSKISSQGSFIVGIAHIFACKHLLRILKDDLGFSAQHCHPHTKYGLVIFLTSDKSKENYIIFLFTSLM